MLGGSEFRLRRGFACGKTLVRRKGAAGQKAGWAVCRTFSILQIKISISPLASRTKGHPEGCPFVFGSAAKRAAPYFGT